MPSRLTRRPAAAASRLSRSARVWALITSGAILTACGGGGGGVSGAPPAVSPSGSTEVTIAGLPISRNLVDASGNFQAQQLLLLDAVTGQVAWSQQVSSDSSQQAVRAFSVSTDGLTVTQGNYTNWFYTNAGKLYVRSAQSATATARQVSSEAAVCSIERAEPVDVTAATSWVLLRTAGADGRCDTTEDNTLKLVRSDADSSTAALSWAGGTLAPLGLHRDASGTLTQLVAFDATQHQVVVVSATTGQATAASANLGATAAVTWLGRAAGRRDQVVLAVQTADDIELRVLSWSTDTATPTLGSSALALHTSDGDTPLLLSSLTPDLVRTDDATGFYLIDSGNVYAMAKGGMSLLTALPRHTVTDGDGSADLPPPVLAGGAMTTSALVLPSVGYGSDGAASTYLVYVVNKGTGQVSTLDVPVATEQPYRVEAHLGDQIVVSQGLDASGVNRALWQADTSGSADVIATQAITGKAQIVASPRADAQPLGSTDSEQVATVWCDISHASGSDLAPCTAANVKSWQLAAKSGITLGSAGLSTVVWQLASPGATRGSQQGVSVSSQNSVSVWLSDSVWTLDALQAGSLKQVTTP